MKNNNKIKESAFLKDKEKIAKIKADLKRQRLEQRLRVRSRHLPRKIFYFIFGIGFLIVFFQKKFYEYREEELRKKVVFVIPIKKGKNNNLSHLSHRKLPSDLRTIKADFCEVVGDNKGLKNALDLQKITIKRLNLPLEVENEFGMIFRFVPRGTFMMGSPKNEAKRGETETLHSTSVPNHMYVGKFEVTQEIWFKIMGNNPSYIKKSWQQPVENMQYKDIISFINKLNKVLGVEPRTYRLLSETEWEYSCRAGSQSAFYYGDDPFKLGLFAEYNDVNGSSPREVGKSLPNIWGLYDMHGNVSEWTRTPFWFYGVGKNVYADTWDTPVYDGDVPMDIKKRKDNFKVVNLTKGRQDNIFYTDDNTNNKYERNELIWADNEKGTFAQFDYEIDTVIFSIYDDNKRFDGQTGVQNNLYYVDLNKNKKWDAKEGLWSHNAKNRDTKGIIIRGGSYNDYSRNCRSAVRFRAYPRTKSYASVWGFRVVRYLKGFDNLPFVDTYTIDK